MRPRAPVPAAVTVGLGPAGGAPLTVVDDGISL
jgi:hypothetical protein